MTGRPCPPRHPARAGAGFYSPPWSTKLAFWRGVCGDPAKFQLQHVVDVFNAAHGTDFKWILLPVAHPELNPIEAIWGQIKDHVRKNNATFTMKAVETLANARRAELNDKGNQKAQFKRSFKVLLEYAKKDDVLVDVGLRDVAKNSKWTASAVAAHLKPKV